MDPSRGYYSLALPLLRGEGVIVLVQKIKERIRLTALNLYKRDPIEWLLLLKV